MKMGLRWDGLFRSLYEVETRSVPSMESKQIRQLMKILHEIVAKSEEIIIPLS